ncbi:MAG: Gldg family protein [Proteobacteria bacterium]|nr:Gldg family protein [Pseudomonadota bacterium]
MKRFLFFMGFIITAFLLMALAVLPEYRLRVTVVTVAYILVFGFILKVTMKEYFQNAYRIIFCRRTKFMFKWVILFFIVVFISVMVLRSGFFSRIKWDVSKDKLLSLSAETKKYLSKLDTRVDITYIRPVTGNDERSLFNGLLGEFAGYTDKIDYRTLHPIINSTEYSEIKKKLPTLSPGSIVVMSSGRIAIADKITEYDLVSAIYRARAGQQSVCISKGHGEPALDDFGEKGGAIILSLLQDRGINLYPVPTDKINYCKVFVILDPSSEFNPSELENIRNYIGYLIVIGGAELNSVQKILGYKGFSVLEKINADFSRGALREYDGGIIVDKFSDYPVVSAIRGSVVVESAYEINCMKCKIFAGISSSGKTTKYVMGGSDNVQIFSGKGLINNFFMRFKGNAELILNMMGVALWPDYPISRMMIKSTLPQFFAISPKYLNIIFIISVVIFPFIILLLSVYCFRQNRTGTE